MVSDLTERLRKPMNRDEFFKVADVLCRETADEIDRLTAALEEANSQLERYRLTNTEENNLNILAHEIDAASRAMKEKP